MGNRAFFAKSQKLKKVCGNIKKKTSGKKVKVFSTKEKSLNSCFTLLAALLKARFQSPKPLGSHFLAVLH
jgi:hypothetical protein